MSSLGGPQMITFEQLSFDHWSLAGGSQVWCPWGVGYPTWPFWGYPTMWPIPWCIWCYHPSPSCGQTDVCENITFPQLRVWAVTRHWYFYLQLSPIEIDSKPEAFDFYFFIAHVWWRDMETSFVEAFGCKVTSSVIVLYRCHCIILDDNCSISCIKLEEVPWMEPQLWGHYTRRP